MANKTYHLTVKQSKNGTLSISRVDQVVALNQHRDTLRQIPRTEFIVARSGTKTKAKAAIAQ